MPLYPLNKIQKPDYYIGLALRTTLKEVEKLRTSVKIKNRERIEKSKTIEKKKLLIFVSTLNGDLKAIVKGFPTIDRLPDFYQELIDVLLKKDEFKKNIATISWIVGQVERLKGQYITLILRAETDPEMGKARNQFIARVDSVLKKRKKTFEFLENARKTMREFPIIKDIPTICISGYPNVGKSTLLSRITTAKPDIQSYAFTTKSLLLGYIDSKIQVIDAPGALRSDFHKMNIIEKQAYLALKYLAQLVVYVFDLSESCGFSIKDQERLFEELKIRFEFKVFIYFSKKDIVDERVLAEFIQKYSQYECFSDPEPLQNRLKMLF